MNLYRSIKGQYLNESNVDMKKKIEDAIKELGLKQEELDIITAGNMDKICKLAGCKQIDLMAYLRFGKLFSELSESEDSAIKLTKDTRDMVEVGDILADNSNRYVVVNVINLPRSKAITVRNENDWSPPIYADPISNWYGTKIIKGPFIRKDGKVIKESEDDFPNKVYVICYGELEIWPTRRAAFDYYQEGAGWCEGAEQERYINILQQLQSGYTMADDEGPEKVTAICDRDENGKRVAKRYNGGPMTHDEAFEYIKTIQPDLKESESSVNEKLKVKKEEILKKNPKISMHDLNSKLEDYAYDDLGIHNDNITKYIDKLAPINEAELQSTFDFVTDEARKHNNYAHYSNREVDEQDKNSLIADCKRKGKEVEPGKYIVDDFIYTVDNSGITVSENNMDEYTVKPVNEAEKITDGLSMPHEDEWVTGAVTINGKRYYVQGKVYEEPSSYGIDDSQISKLWVNEINKDGSLGKTLIAYDRGWDSAKVNTGKKTLLKPVMDLLIDYRSKNHYMDDWELEESENLKESANDARILDMENTGGGVLSYVGEVGDYNFIGDIGGSIEFLPKELGINSWEAYSNIEDDGWNGKYGEDIQGTYDFEQKYAEFLPEYLPDIANALEQYAEDLKPTAYRDWILEEVNSIRNAKE